MACQWHRTAENTLATHGADGTVRIWDVENSANTMTYDGLPQIATAMKWNPKGDRLGVIIKGGNMYSYDPRT
jgi:WD40 repeat protein